MIESTTELQNMQCSIAERLNYISGLAKKAIHFALSFPISPSVLSTSSETANLCTINELTDELLEKNFNDINDKESSEWKESDDE